MKPGFSVLVSRGKPNTRVGDAIRTNLLQKFSSPMVLSLMRYCIGLNISSILLCYLLNENIIVLPFKRRYPFCI